MPGVEDPHIWCQQCCKERDSCPLERLHIVVIEPLSDTAGLWSQMNSRTYTLNNKMKAISFFCIHNTDVCFLITTESWKSHKNCRILTCVCFIARSTRRMLPLSSFVRRTKADVWMAQNFGCESKNCQKRRKRKNTKRRDKLSDLSFISTKFILPKISEYNWLERWKSSPQKIIKPVLSNIFVKNVFIWAVIPSGSNIVNKSLRE